MFMFNFAFIPLNVVILRNHSLMTTNIACNKWLGVENTNHANEWSHKEAG